MGSKTTIKRGIAVILSAAIIATMSFAGGINVYAASTDSTTATKGVYWFDPHEVGTDITDNYIYDDELLKGDSLEYNEKLAKRYEFL